MVNGASCACRAWSLRGCARKVNTERFYKTGRRQRAGQRQHAPLSGNMSRIRLVVVPKPCSKDW